MKTKTGSSHLALLAIALTAAFVGQPLFGQGVVQHQIVITETSSTSTGLTATYDGSTAGIIVTFNGPDSWTITFSNPVELFAPNVAWVERENSSLGNAVAGIQSSPFTHQLNVFSDHSTTHFRPVADESTVNTYGADRTDGGSISATFDDDAATAEVPDTGTTGSLFGLSLTGLAFLRRKL